jgi:hypothetical protein
MHRPSGQPDDKLIEKHEAGFIIVLGGGAEQVADQVSEDAIATGHATTDVSPRLGIAFLGCG